MGYHRAGFEVVGVDVRPQPRYPFEFWQEDVMVWGKSLPDRCYAQAFDAIHASPPCQAHTSMSNRWRGRRTRADRAVNLIPATRELLQESGLPYVIENVTGAQKHMMEPTLLSGPVLGLPRIYRPRLFETNWFLMVPRSMWGDEAVGVYGDGPYGQRLWSADSKRASSLAEAREVMGIDWMTWEELREAVPPAYTEYIGAQLRTQFRSPEDSDRP
jgi:DNA (cytosine-5)-methyltransferase 1